MSDPKHIGSLLTALTARPRLVVDQPAPQPPPGPCTACTGVGYHVGTAGPWARALPCACLTSCATCDGSGFVLGTREATPSKAMGPRTYEVLMDCRCRKVLARVERFSAAQLPAALAHATLDSFSPSAAEQRQALEQARAFAQTYAPSARGLLLSGPVGTGKSHLMAAVLRHLALERGVRVRFVEMSFLFSAIRQGYAQNLSDAEIIAPLADVEVLGVDELGKGRASPFELETLSELVCRRYNAGRVTLFTTNYPVEASPARPTPGGYRATDVRPAVELLEHRVGQRTFSRLHEMAEMVQFPESLPDWRRRTR